MQFIPRADRVNGLATPPVIDTVHWLPVSLNRTATLMQLLPRLPLSSARRWLGVALALATLLALAFSGLPVNTNRTAEIHTSLGHSAIATLPLSFVPNLGQTAAVVQMQANGLGGTLTFASTTVTLLLPATQNATPLSLHMNWLGANPQAVISGIDRLPGLYNSYVGAPTQWRSNVPTYGSLLYRQLYPGIDLRYDGQDGTLKGTYTVAPGVDPTLIRWHYQEAQSVTRALNGDLDIRFGDGSVLTEEAPIAWQEAAGLRTPVEASFVVTEDQRIHFALGTYNPNLPLTIDPTLHYSTFLGGNSTDSGNAIAVGADGSIVVTGQTYSTNFPSASTALSGNTDIFVSKLNAQGSALLYTTLIGGGSDEESYGLALDTQGNVWITGQSWSANFPADRLDQSYRGNGDTVVAKFGSTGALIHSGYLGLEVYDNGYGIAVDAQGDAYVTGDAAATYGPEAFVKKIKADMSAVLYSAYFGAAKRGFDKGTSARAIAVDTAGNAFVTGRTNARFSEEDEGGLQPFCTEFDGIDCTFDDAMMIQLNVAGDSILYYTYLGGNGNDIGTAIAVDKEGNILVAGYTFAADFPTQSAMQPQKRGQNNFADAFVTKFNPAGTALIYSTYLGGEFWEEAHGLAVDQDGNAYVVGMTNSPDDFPINADAPQPTLGNGICNVGSTERYCYDGFATKLTPAGALAWSTFVGGSADDLANGVAVDGAGNAYVVGSTDSHSFPVTNGVAQVNKGLNDDAFLVKLGAGTVQPTPTATAVTPATTPTPTATVILTPTVTPSNTPAGTPTRLPEGFSNQLYLPVVQR